MTGEHQPAIPVAVEQVVSRLDELTVVLGDAARTVIPVVRARLIEAMAARDRGDSAAVLHLVGEAMDQLAGLADRLDPTEALLMRALAQRFRTALLRGDHATARSVAGTMRDKSGAHERLKR